ncbi:hypothetical protein JVU11DRAFT_8749 [Chiua virens]|nr:hypothetical protein JVU11DRAFT_8749 [Chiua virens]
MQDSQRVSPLWSPSQLDLGHDIQLSLSHSGGYIRNALSSRRDNSVSTYFDPKNRPRGTLDDFLASDGAFFEDGYSTDPDLTLYDVEQAVERGIDAWLDRVTDNDGACVKLEVLGEKYSSKAAETYAGNPELLSVMLLTTVELWVALDTLAIREIPILADYSPEVPASLLEVLLFQKNASLHRLRRAHQYISNRHSRSNRGSVFSSATGKDSFAVRFYGESFHLQFLKARIEEAAQRDRDKKMVQLEKENARHADLKQKCVNTDHSSAITQDGREYHPKNCTKCKLEQRLRRLQIPLHEWPLPTEKLYAEAVVFELDCPVSFNMWRTATFHLLVDLCSPTLKPKDPYIKLTQYDALRPYFVQHPRSRITLGSDTKPFTVSHYNRVSLPTTEKRVCVNNGLKFSGFDTHSRTPVSEALGRVNVTRYCTYELPSGPYRSLQKFVVTPCHVSNEVMANQLDCHKELSIHEYLAFGHLRSGGSLQWLNILRELRGRSLTFRRYEVHALIAQAASQAGPLASEEWMWHQEIRQPSFCYALIEELESLFKDVKANWLEGVTMDTISFLLGRILVSNPDQAVSQKAIELLCAVRHKTFSWVMDLSKSSHGNTRR